MDSMNAILLDTRKDSDGKYIFDDYGVKPVQCVPNAISPFDYVGFTVYKLELNITS